MKTLIQNYTSALSTEPMYIHRCLIEAGEEAVLWSDPNQSAFDSFDFTKPDLFISHFKFLTQDIIKYLSNNKNISMVLNVTGAQQNELETLEAMAKDSGVNIPLVFTNLYDVTNNLSSKSINLKSLYPAADIFLPIMPTPDYEIDTCILSITNNDMVKEAIKSQDNYHIASLGGQGQEEYHDMLLDISSAASFYHKYKKVILADDINVVSSQLLFDSLLRSQKVNIKVPEEQQELLDGILATLFVEGDGDDKDLREMLKGQIRRRHNCFRRVARLFKLVKSSEVSNKLEKIGEKI